jgi:hypothetical protein
LGKERSFYGHVCFLSEKNGGGGDLVRLYLVAQKCPEDKNLMVGTIPYELQSVIIRIEKSSDFSEDLWKIFQIGSKDFEN